MVGILLKREPLIRFALLAFLALTVAPLNLHADQPVESLIIAADQHVATMMSPLPKDTRVTVLVRHPLDSYDVINARALRSKSAAAFVISSELNHELLSLFKERFYNHGLRILKVGETRRSISPNPSAPGPSSFALRAAPSQLP